MMRFLTLLRPVRILLPSLAKMSTNTSKSIKETPVSSSLILREADDANRIKHWQQAISGDNLERSDDSRPLVLLYEWLWANPSAVQKYCDLYHSRGLDVLTIRGSLVHFLKPEKGFYLAKEVLNFLKTRQRGTSLNGINSRYIVHAFSIGAYIQTLCLMLSQQDPEKYAWFRSDICGNVYDSIVIGSLHNMATGVALSVSNSVVMQSVMRSLTMKYFKFMGEKTVKFYDEAVSFFKSSPVLVPTLFFFSYNDPMSDSSALEEMIQKWQQELPDMPVTVKSWSVSVHTAHIKYHEAEYTEVMNNFLSRLTAVGKLPRN